MAWPHFDNASLSRVPELDAGVAVKLFSPPLIEGWAEPCGPADGRLRFEFDPDRVTHLGLQVDYGSWASVPDPDPCLNLGLEPGIGAPDTLDAAVHHWPEYGQLPPGKWLGWWLRITVA